MSYDTIKDLVIDSFVTEGKMPSFESLTKKVLEHFPNSAWQKSHYSWYKSQINTGKIEISMSTREDSDSSDDLIEESIIQSIETQVSLEKDLQRYLSMKISELEDGLIIVEGGVEYLTQAGRVDLLARDRVGNLVVIELKAGKAKDSALGQLLGYVGCLSLENNSVRGILVASDFDTRVIFASKNLPNITLVKYELAFRLREVS